MLDGTFLRNGCNQEKGKLCSATKLLNNDSDNITLDDFLSSTKLVILLVCEDASTAVT
jgi:hypothetical protein